MSFEAQPRTGRWTVADIGGTRARLAHWSAHDGLQPPVRLRNDDFAGLIELFDHWFGAAASGPRRLAIALAMPVGADVRTLTNRDWQFDANALIERLRLDTLVIVNDFAAAAAGVDALPEGAARVLNPEHAVAIGTNRVVLGPGTGLGTAAIVDGRPARILASEAGHMTFGSAHALAPRLEADGGLRWGRVSWERVLCGDGLAWIDAQLRAEQQWDLPASVARRAASGEPGAVAAVKAFSHMLGEYAGDVCLAFQAMRGVYLCGGVLHGVQETFDRTAFLEAFAAKGRFAEQLARVPCFLATGHELGISGVARFLAGGCDMPSREWQAAGGQSLT